MRKKTIYYSKNEFKKSLKLLLVNLCNLPHYSKNEFKKSLKPYYGTISY